MSEWRAFTKTILPNALSQLLKTTNRVSTDHRLTRSLLQVPGMTLIDALSACQRIHSNSTAAEVWTEAERDSVLYLFYELFAQLNPTPQVKECVTVENTPNT